MNSKEEFFKRYYNNMNKEEIIRVATEDKMRADKNAKLLHKAIEDNKKIVEEKDKLITVLLKRIAILEREVEEHEGF